MKLNGITCTGYGKTEQGFVATLSGTNGTEILNLNTDILQITADNDAVVEAFAGFSTANSWKFDVSNGHYHVVFPVATPESIAVKEMQKQIKTLAQTVVSMQIGGTAR